MPGGYNLRSECPNCPAGLACTTHYIQYLWNLVPPAPALPPPAVRPPAVDPPSPESAVSFPPIVRVRPRLSTARKAPTVAFAALGGLCSLLFLWQQMDWDPISSFSYTHPRCPCLGALKHTRALAADTRLVVTYDHITDAIQSHLVWSGIQTATI
jgi:hypothetical protein